MQRTVLVIDDNDINRLNLRLLLKERHQVLEAGDLEAAEEELRAHRVDVIVLDLALPPEPDNPEIGLNYLKRMRKESPDIPVVVITGHDERAIASRARRLGAADFFGKPFDPDEVRDTIERVMEARWRRLRERQMQQALESRVNMEILGDSPAMQALRTMIGQVAATPSTVLIRGETGTGKELIARNLHRASARADGPFVAINCASVEASVLESELFGHEKGAFAGANRRKIGWFEQANGGTLFLDEVAGLPLAVQARLLRVLESGEFQRLGGDAVIRSDVRLLCSTREDLEAMVAEGRFRDDLYYRIHVVGIFAPPLREHMEDLPLLAEHVLARKAALLGKPVRGFSREAMDALTHYDWPGNVRELENVIERAVVLARGEIIESFPALAGPRPREDDDPIGAWLASLPAEGVQAEKLVASFEKRLVETALARHGGVKTRAGRWLGFGDRAKDKMRYLCDKYGIESGGEGAES